MVVESVGGRIMGGGVVGVKGHIWRQQQGGNHKLIGGGCPKRLSWDMNDTRFLYERN